MKHTEAKYLLMILKKDLCVGSFLRINLVN